MELNKDKVFYTWREFDEDCERIAAWAKGKNFLNIYGIPRGGLVVAVRLSHFTGMSIVLNPLEITKSTLVVDDISDSGKTLSSLRKDASVLAAIATVFWNKESPQPDFWCREKNGWVVFPWETEVSSKYDFTT